MALKTVDPRFSVYVGGLPADVSLSDMEELLYELFLQVRDSLYAKVDSKPFTLNILKTLYGLICQIYSTQVKYSQGCVRMWGLRGTGWLRPLM